MRNKTTNEEFTKKAKIVHGDKYDYSLVDYQNFDKKIKIICPTHGIFEQTPRCHLNGNCFKCSKEKLLSNTEEFIKKAKVIHGNKYDYSLVDYKDSRHKIKIICKLHGEFDQTAQNHLNGKRCSKCYGTNKSNTEEFIKKAKIIHGDKYDYSLVDYKNRSKPIKILCQKHGLFEQLPYLHLKGCICYNCYAKNRCESTEEFIKKAKVIHGDKYDYSSTEYKNVTNKMNIICQKHGLFEQSASSHLRGFGCQICKNSKGEEKISNFLKLNNISFEREKRFENCRNILPLPFDFYLPKLNICIEFDGEQHFVEKQEWNNNLIDIKKRDIIKNIYCKNNNITLYRINYKNINIIEEKLITFFNENFKIQ
jgi:hypothetical protein